MERAENSEIRSKLVICKMYAHEKIKITQLNFSFGCVDRSVMSLSDKDLHSLRLVIYFHFVTEQSTKFYSSHYHSNCFTEHKI